MIDWITVQIIPEFFPKFGKRTIEDEHGNIERVTSMPKNISSSETSIFVMEWADRLLISGNPTKFVQGHNIIGIDDWSICDEMLRRVLLQLHAGSYTLEKMTRMDITYSNVLASYNDVEIALQQIGKTSAARWSRPVVKYGTVYFGSKKRQQLKIYDKAAEFKRSNKNPDFKNIIIPPILRLELTLAYNHFDDNGWIQYIDSDKRQEAWNNAMNNIRINELSTFDPDVLPKNLLKIYLIWKEGINLRQLYAAGTLYNYASELRKYGIDIWQEPEQSNIINLHRVLQARPLTIEDVLELGLPVWTPDTNQK